MKCFTIPERLFKTEPIFVVNCTTKELERHLKRKYKIITDLDWVDDCVTGTVLYFETPDRIYRVVWLRSFKKNNIDDLGTLIHEITHLVIRICEHKGIAVSANLEDGRVNDEPVAYMMDYFVREFLERIKKNN